MTDIKVPPGALRAFAADCRSTADALDALDATGVARGASAALPHTDTAQSLAGVGADLEAALTAVATRHRTMADVADGTQDNYDATEDEIVTGFRAMSHR